MKTKQTKAALIAELKRKLVEAEAAQVHLYHFGEAAISKASTEHLMASGVIITLTALGGREILKPTLIRGGISLATVEALKADFLRSYNEAVIYKPKGAV